jgi:hypothetical protein
MEIMQSDIPLRPEENRQSADLRFRQQFEDRLKELQADVAERPFLCLAVAFVAGFVSNTLPARMLFLVVVRIVSWLLGPVVLLMGVIKLSDMFSSSRRNEPTILKRP